MTTAIASRATPADVRSQVVHRGREFIMRPGSMVLLKLDEPFFAADGASQKRFTNVHLPMATLKAMVADVDDLVGRELEPGGALSLAMDYSDLLLEHPGAVDEAGIAIAAHLMDLAALGLGARGDVAAAARRGGLRAVRLKAVLTILEARFAEPDFSAQKLAAAAGLSERYVNELLYRGRRQFHHAADRIAAAQGGGIAGACRERPHQRHRLRLRLQRPVLFQPLLSPPVRPDADCGAGQVKCGQARRRDATCTSHLRYHLMAMSNDDIFTPNLRAAIGRLPADPRVVL